MIGRYKTRSFFYARATNDNSATSRPVVFEIRREQLDRSKKGAKSSAREPPPAPRPSEPSEPSEFLKEYIDEGQGSVAEIEGFEQVQSQRRCCSRSVSPFSCSRQTHTSLRCPCCALMLTKLPQWLNHCLYVFGRDGRKASRIEGKAGR